MTATPAAAVPMEDVLLRIGFIYHADNNQPCYTYDLGLFELTAAPEIVDWIGRKLFVLRGMYHTRRRIEYVDYKMPLHVETFEQGVALLAYALRGHEPRVGAHPWFVDGLAWKDHLPWMRDTAASIARDAEIERSTCYVARAWFRLAAKDLLARAASSPEFPHVRIGFDGRILTFDVAGHPIVVGAKGEAWPTPVLVAAEHFQALPKRFPHDPVRVTLWENAILIHHARLPVAQTLAVVP